MLETRTYNEVLTNGTYNEVLTKSSGQTDITFDFLLQLYRIAKKYGVDDLAILAANHFVQKLTTVQLSEVGNIVQSLLGEGGMYHVVAVAREQGVTDHAVV